MMRWTSHAVRLLDGEQEALFIITDSGEVHRHLPSTGVDVPVLDRRFQRLKWPPLRCAGDPAAVG